MHRQLHDWLRRLPPNVQGALWLVAGGFIFTSTGAMIRLLSTQIESVQTAFFRAVISVILLLPLIVAGRVRPWHSKRIAGHFWRTLMGTTSMVLGFYAVSMLPLADATAISFSQPLFSVLVAALIVGEKVRWRRWSATIVGFVGVLVMVQPGQGSLELGPLVALANAATVALSILLVKRLSDSETPLMILTQFAIFSTLLLLPPAIWVWRWPDLWGWVLAFGVAFTATVGQYFWVQAFKVGEMSAVAPFEYLRLPFAVFVGWLIWGEMPVIWTYVGAAIVIASALYIAHREAQLARERRRAALANPQEIKKSRSGSLGLEEPRARLRAMGFGDVHPGRGEGRDHDRGIVGVAQPQQDVGDGVDRQDEIGERAEQGGADRQRRRRIGGAVERRHRIFAEGDLAQGLAGLRPETLADLRVVGGQPVGRAHTWKVGSVRRLGKGAAAA